jgi:hypothetical protein
MHSNNEDAAALLGDSEIFAVKHTPRDTIPEFIQRLEYDCEVSSSVTSEKAVDVFNDDGSWQASLNEAHKFVKEARFRPSKPCSRPHSRQREVLARESCCPNIGIRDVCINDLRNICLSGNPWPMLVKNTKAKRVNLTLKGH